MNEKFMKSALKSLADQGVPPQEIDLWPAILAGMHVGVQVEPLSRRKFVTRRVAVISLVASAILALVFVILGPQKVLARLGGLFGYVPGAGFVQDIDSLRVLDTPAPNPPAAELPTGAPRTGSEPDSQTYQTAIITQEREGVILTVLQGIADSEHTVVVYQVNNLPRVENPFGEDVAFPQEDPFLRLPDGAMLKRVGGDGGGWLSGYQERLVFPPLPVDVSEVTLVIPGLWDMPPGTAPENWEIPLHFELAAPGSVAIPVTEPAESGPVSYKLHGITFSLEKVAQVNDGYLFGGSLTWRIEDFPQGINPGEILLTDGNGQQIPTQRVRSLGAPNTDSGQRLDWTLRTDRTAFVGPLKFSMNSVGTAVQNNLQFELNLGSDPQVGQTWEINRAFQVEGHSVKVVSAQLESHPAGLYLNFKFEGDPDVTCVSIGDASGEALWDSTGSCRGAVEGITSAIHYASIPRGARLLALGFQYLMRGPWQVSWTPPAAPVQPAPAPTPEPCLTYEKWRQVEAQGNSLPEGLDGRLLAVDQGKIYLSNLDGSEQHFIGEGSQPALSLDGTRVVFVGDQGLFLVETASGQKRAVPATQPGDSMPKWSPDGAQIAFLRQGDIYLIGPDGSGLRQLTNNLQIQSLTGWTPDGKQVVVEIPGPPDGSVSVKLVDTSSGEIQEIFQASPSIWTFTAFSPDGHRVVFVDRIFGQDARSLFLAPLDGKQVAIALRRPLIALDYVGIVPANLVWGPDGKWLLVNMYEARQYGGIQTPLLLQPDTCQVIRLGAVQGSVMGWIQP